MGSISSFITVPLVGASGFIVIVPTSVVVFIAFVTSAPIFKVIFIPSVVCSGPLSVWGNAVWFGAKSISNFVLSHLR